LQNLATARPNGSKEGPGTLGGRDQAAHELGQVRKPGTGDRKFEKDAEGRGRSRGGKGGIYGRRESSEATTHAPSPIRQPPNPGG